MTGIHRIVPNIHGRVTDSSLMWLQRSPFPSLSSSCDEKENHDGKKVLFTQGYSKAGYLVKILLGRRIEMNRMERKLRPVKPTKKDSKS